MYDNYKQLRPQGSVRGGRRGPAPPCGGALRSRHQLLVLVLLVLAFGIIVTIVNIYQLRLIQGDPYGRSPPEGRTDYYSRRPLVWISGKRVTSGYLRHVFNVFERIGYGIETGDDVTGFDVMWAHDYPFGTHKGTMSKLRPHQRVNHFPGSGYLTNKLNLVSSHQQLDEVPRAYRIPQDKEDLLSHMELNPDKMWVQKSSNHRGVKIKKQSELDLNQDGTFVQEYIHKPYLIDGRRFDIGIYTTLTSIDPLRLYIFEGDWLVRFCPDQYYPFDATNINSYVITDDYLPPWKIPSLKKAYEELDYNRKESLFAYLRQDGRDPDLLAAKLKDAIRKTVLMKEASLIQATSNYRSSKNFFEMVRFDFVFDEDLNVYLMEVNMSPNLSSGHFPANRLMYEQVIYSMLGLVGVAKSVSDDITKWTDDEKDMQVSTRDIHVQLDRCMSRACQDKCGAVECRLCKDCLKADHVDTLQRAYLEHNNRRVWRRVFPVPFESQLAARDWKMSSDAAFLSLAPANQWMALWFRGKCLQDATWCQ